jgi:hypothetical protein
MHQLIVLVLVCIVSMLPVPRFLASKDKTANPKIEVKAKTTPAIAKPAKTRV